MLQDNNSNTALILAASNGHVDCVKELVKAGAELHATDSYGNTALNTCYHTMVM